MRASERASERARALNKIQTYFLSRKQTVREHKRSRAHNFYSQFIDEWRRWRDRRRRRRRAWRKRRLLSGGDGGGEIGRQDGANVRELDRRAICAASNYAII